MDTVFFVFIDRKYCSCHYNEVEQKTEKQNLEKPYRSKDDTSKTFGVNRILWQPNYQTLCLGMSSFECQMQKNIFKINSKTIGSQKMTPSTRVTLFIEIFADYKYFCNLLPLKFPIINFPDFHLVFWTPYSCSKGQLEHTQT